jgi:type I restriction enzyme, S subunit
MSAIQQLLTDHLDIWTAADTAKKSGRGRSSGTAGSVYGIKKLRELILELAVRGKLVPQDESDEPASELLKRIAAEKAKLVAEGKIKKSKPLAEITDDEKPFELPVGWEWTRLDHFVLSIISGGTPSKNNSEFWNGDIPWASVKDLNVERFLDKTQDYITQEGLVAGSKLANKGDLIICTRMGLGKIAIASIDVAINQDLKALKITSQLDIDYFINFYSTLKIIGSGMTVAGIKQDELLGFYIPTPPLAEQHRIVAKVDELMALCDQLENQHNNAAEAHEKLVTHLLGTLTQSHNAEDFNTHWQRISEHFDTLFTTEASIDALKQTLLKLAVMGKLVPQDPNDEPASELLKRIQAEKAKLIAEGKIKKDIPLAEIMDEDKPFDLPVGWEWVRLIDIIKIASGDGLTSDQMDKTGEIPVYGGNGITGYHSIANVNNPTLVIGRVGYYCGSIHVTPESAWVTDNAFITKFSKENISMEFLYWLLKITNLKENESATAQPVISGKKVYPIVIALPPLLEQRGIVAKIAELMAICDQLKARITSVNQLRQKLADVIVEQVIS